MTELGGRPITGDISYYGRDTSEQRPIEELLAALDALFELPEVLAIRWHQYTPYFNDGEPCTFSVYDPLIRLESVAEDEGDYEDGYLWAYEIEYGDKGTGSPVKPLLKTFEQALTGGSHDVELRKHFGDPAEIVATREGFAVEYYDHD